MQTQRSKVQESEGFLLAQPLSGICLFFFFFFFFFFLFFFFFSFLKELHKQHKFFGTVSLTAKL